MAHIVGISMIILVWATYSVCARADDVIPSVKEGYMVRMMQEYEYILV